MRENGGGGADIKRKKELQGEKMRRRINGRENQKDGERERERGKSIKTNKQRGEEERESEKRSGIGEKNMNTFNRPSCANALV